MRKISIIIPAYNEEKSIGELLETIRKVNIESLGFLKEIIVIDDGSSDDTLKIAQQFPEVKSYSQKNKGKGRAVQNGIKKSTGELILVQDADMEYDPHDYIPMLRALQKQEGSGYVAVYGSRVLMQLKKRGSSSLFASKGDEQNIGPWLAGVILTYWTKLLYGTLITDTLTAYKLYPADLVKSFNIVTSGFETDHEITAKLIRSGVSIVEVPIHYSPRTVIEGKKIRPVDGLIAVATLLKYRFVK